VDSAKEPPRVRATDSEEARRIQGDANRAQRWAEEQHQAATPCTRDLHLEFEEAGLLMFNIPQANQGAAMARLQQANPSPEAEATMAYL
jgi:alkylation response protein AidB-like acyl-CoA dehydrogenase